MKKATLTTLLNIKEIKIMSKIRALPKKSKTIPRLPSKPDSRYESTQWAD